MFIINAVKRNKIGKRECRRLRKMNKIPAIIYGGNMSNVNIELDHDVIFNMQIKDSFYREKISLIVDSVQYYVIVKAVQRHAYKLKLLHFDFLKVL